MKQLALTCIILFSLQNTYAQKVEILLIGVSHNYSNYPRQNFEGIYKKIRKFQPAAFYGEFLSKADEERIMDYWCKQDNVNRLERLRKNRYLQPERLPKIRDSLQKLSLVRPADYRIKADLSHAYYLDQDVANAHYQYWQVFQALRKTPDADLENYVDKLLSPGLDTTGRSMKRLKTSEYAHIAFPMMQEMGIDVLLAMDNQEYDLNWNASWAAFDKKFALFRKDSPAAIQSALKSSVDKINRGFEKYALTEKTSVNVTEWLNTDEASAISASGDFYLPEMYSLYNFPKEEMLSKIHWWIKRNEAMCDNVVKGARQAALRKVVVIAGANHRKYLQDIFNAIPGVSVKNINEFN